MVPASEIQAMFNTACQKQRNPRRSALLLGRRIQRQWFAVSIRDLCRCTYVRSILCDMHGNGNFVSWFEGIS